MSRSIIVKLKERPLLFLSISFVVGFGLACLLVKSGVISISRGTLVGPLREKSPYKLIQPLLLCQTANNLSFREQKIIGTNINALINDIKQKGLARDISVYFQNLTNGHWTGYNEDELYSPASLNKVALLIAYLRQAEVDPSILDKNIVFVGQLNARSNDSDFTPMVKGKSYSVKDLLYRLIVYSDNDAKDYLHGILDQDTINRVFTDLDLPAPKAGDIGDTTSARSYSLFFRTLYNATYLSQFTSEAALELLSQTKFNPGLMAGIPTTTTVAHKFGHRIFNPPVRGITEELHDCGIVYKKDSPYFLCVMTKGSNLKDLETAIQQVSKNVYDNSQ